MFTFMFDKQIIFIKANKYIIIEMFIKSFLFDQNIRYSEIYNNLKQTTNYKVFISQESYRGRKGNILQYQKFCQFPTQHVSYLDKYLQFY